MITSSPSIVIGRDYAGLDDACAVNEIAVIGNGFFILRDPATNERFAAQAENFSLDCHGFLVTGAGARLQGRINSATKTIGDLQINATGSPASAAPEAAMLCYSIDARGQITVHLSDGTSFVRGQIMLQDFQDPEALVSQGNNLFSNLSAAGPLPAMSPPGKNGLGTVHWGVLEFSQAGSTNWTN